MPFFAAIARNSVRLGGAPEEIRVLIPDRVPAYITWKQYLANQRRIRENRSLFAITNDLLVVGGNGRMLRFDPKNVQYSEVKHTNSAQIKPLGLLKDGRLCVTEYSEGANGKTRLASMFKILNGM